MQGKITDGLVQKEVLKREGHRVLWVFNVDRFPTQNPSPESEIRNKIRNIVLFKHKANEEDVALLSLLKACGLTKEVFSKDEYKSSKRLTKEITANEQIGKEVSAVVTEMTAAVTAAIVAATAASATSQ